MNFDFALKLVSMLCGNRHCRRMIVSVVHAHYLIARAVSRQRAKDQSAAGNGEPDRFGAFAFARETEQNSAG
jgi:hypothetical protein